MFAWKLSGLNGLLIKWYLRVEEGELSLELLVGDHEGHALAGQVDLAVLGHLESVVDHSLHGGGALGRTGQGGAADDETVQEVFNEDELGVGVGQGGDAVVLFLALELGSLFVALEVSHLRGIDDGLDCLVVVLGSGEGLHWLETCGLPG